MKNSFDNLRFGSFFFCPHHNICIKTRQSAIADKDSIMPESRNAFALDGRIPVFIPGGAQVVHITNSKFVKIGDYHLWVSAHTEKQGGFGPIEIDIEVISDFQKKERSDFILVKPGLTFGLSDTPVTALLIGRLWMFVHNEAFTSYQRNLDLEPAAP